MSDLWTHLTMRARKLRLRRQLHKLERHLRDELGPGVLERHRLEWPQQQAEDSEQERRSGPGWHGRLDGYGPVQGFGSVDGHAWYFRARWAGWSIEIAEPVQVDLHDVTVGHEIGDWRTEDEMWGEDKYAASYMPYATAWEIIEQCIARFRSGLLPYLPARPARP